MIVGIEGYDAEDLEYATSPEFWHLITERRKGPMIRLDQLKSQLDAKKESRKHANGTAKGKKRKD